MKILHYSLGLPPYRTGGLTKYSYSLCVQQVKDGHSVHLLYPGEMLVFGKTRIKNRRKHESGISIHELIKPLPVSLGFGIDDPSEYMKDIDEKVFMSFLTNQKFDIIHLHTLMGIYPSFISAAKKCDIKIVYTTHDIYGIWPTVNELSISDEKQRINFILGDICMKEPISKKKILIMQSGMYKKLKDTSFVKKLRKSVKKSHSSSIALNSSDVEYSNLYQEYQLKRLKYEKLSDFYKFNFFDKIDYYLYNSDFTREIFMAKLGEIKGDVKWITHSDMERFSKNDECKTEQDNEKKSQKIQILFSGSMDHLKGFPYFFDIVNNNIVKPDFECIIVGEYTEKPKWIKTIEPYTYDCLDRILSDIDFVLAPSMGVDTLNFTVMEGLSRGIPGIVSSMVGAKSLVQNLGYGYVFSTSEELIRILENIGLVHYQVSESKESIDKILNFTTHVQCLYETYEDLV